MRVGAPAVSRHPCGALASSSGINSMSHYHQPRPVVLSQTAGFATLCLRTPTTLTSGRVCSAANDFVLQQPLQGSPAPTSNWYTSCLVQAAHQAPCSESSALPTMLTHLRHAARIPATDTAPAGATPMREQSTVGQTTVLRLFPHQPGPVKPRPTSGCSVPGPSILRSRPSAPRPGPPRRVHFDPMIVEPSNKYRRQRVRRHDIAMKVTQEVPGRVSGTVTPRSMRFRMAKPKVVCPRLRRLTCF